MSYYEKEEVDFIKRSYQIVEEYIKEKKENEKYEVTLLINFLFGISICIKNNWLENFKSTSIDELLLDTHGISKSDLTIHNENVKNLKDLIWALRNGICHWNDSRALTDYDGKKLKGIIFEENDKGNIGSILIQGTLNHKHSVDIKFINSDNLKTFIYFLQNNI
ncbi:MAG: HEPN family nuclease [Cetobacterium sp.]|uniref:HEPN family nuclease n=1 Tax=Cetobacterium sp. TaxID=2071632 RepID=UPI003F32DD3F